MTSIVGLGRRWWTIATPPAAAKSPDAIRFGLLGASRIGPLALINPAKSHPEIVVSAVAARDQVKANAYATKYGIPKVHKSYQELLDDPEIDAVYIPLPNGLHYEWAIRSLRAGKHVLLEKPFVSNAEEARSLYEFYNSLPSPRPVLLEAFHYRFHPAWHLFLSLLTPSIVTSASASLCAPALILPANDIRFVYDLAGGALMDMGTYTVSTLRQIFGTEPEECISVEPRMLAPAGLIDQAFKGSWRFPNGGIGTIDADLAKKVAGVPWQGMPRVVVRQKAAQVDDANLKDGQVHEVSRSVIFSNFLIPTFWHRIDIVDEHVLKTADRKVVKTWAEKESKKGYTWANVERDGYGKAATGEEWWTTYRYMAEEFVNKIKGREGSGVWVDGEDSIKQMAFIDSGYVKAGLPIRPTSTFK